MKTRPSISFMVCMAAILVDGAGALYAASTPIHAVLNAGKTFAPFSVNIYEFTVK